MSQVTINEMKTVIQQFGDFCGRYHKIAVVSHMVKNKHKTQRELLMDLLYSDLFDDFCNNNFVTETRKKQYRQYAKEHNHDW